MRKTVYFIEGDGIGQEVFGVAKNVINAAVDKTYADGRGLDWVELLAGEKAKAEVGEYLPEATLEALKTAELAMKGPLATPVGGGIRSLNVTLRQVLDLYACIRPIKYYDGIETPVKRPDLVDMCVFRENTEDVYAGIEYQAGTPEAKKLLAFLQDEMGATVRQESGVGIKPISEFGSKRLVKKAIEYAVAQGKPSVTLVHKGNIMKFTEGAFAKWGYEIAAEAFAAQTCTEKEPVDGKIVVNDRIADAMFQEVLMRPEQYSVIATTNLNGDYISDALAAQVGGLGMAPGVNMNDTLAFYEATHGTAPTIAGQDKANPCSVVLCGAMLLEHIGWTEAAEAIHKAVNTCVGNKTVTVDLATQMQGATTVGCTEFGDLLLKAM